MKLVQRRTRVALRRTTQALVLVGALSLIACDRTKDSSGPDGPTSPAAARIEPVTATAVTAVVGTVVAPSPTVRVTDRLGRPVPGVLVTFVSTAGSALANAAAETSADGHASGGAWTLGQLADTYTVTARAAGLPNVVFTAIATPGPVARVHRLSGDGQLAAPGATLVERLRVSVADAFGNLVGGARVTFVVGEGGGAIDGAVVEADVLGIATSGSWTLGPTEGIQEVDVQAGSAHTTFQAVACGEMCERQQLLFVRDNEIYRTNLFGADIRRLTPDDPAPATQPAWSPDGRRIAFVRDRTTDGARLGSGTELYLMDADGSNVLKHAVGFHSPTLIVSPGIYAAWRPVP